MLKNLITATSFTIAIIFMLLSINLEISDERQAKYTIMAIFLFSIIVVINQLWRM